MNYPLPKKQYIFFPKKTPTHCADRKKQYSYSFLLLWKFTADAGIIDSFVFSSPSKIVTCFISMLKDGSSCSIQGLRFLRLLSFCICFLFFIIICNPLWCSRKLSETLEPYLVILNSLPKSALAPLLIVWLGSKL